MAKQRCKAEELIHKLRQTEALIAQGAIAEAR
jgi:hypothetical protein